MSGKKMVTLLYFARLREVFGTASEQVEVPASVKDVRALTEWLRRRGEPWESELQPTGLVRFAVGQRIADPETTFGDDAEIAFFPPVTGG